MNPIPLAIHVYTGEVLQSKYRVCDAGGGGGGGGGVFDMKPC